MRLTYASPGAAEYYRRNKKFAGGTVLVKEVFGTDHAQMTTGDARDYKKDCVGCHILAKNRRLDLRKGLPSTSRQLGRNECR